MSVRTEDNTARVNGSITQKASVFLRLLADGIVEASTPNTPKDRGNLRRDVVKQVLGLHGKIVWGKNYAAIQETKQFENYTTAGTGPHFAENAVRAQVNDAAKYLRKAGL